MSIYSECVQQLQEIVVSRQQELDELATKAHHENLITTKRAILDILPKDHKYYFLPQLIAHTLTIGRESDNRQQRYCSLEARNLFTAVIKSMGYSKSVRLEYFKEQDKWIGNFLLFTEFTLDNIAKDAGNKDYKAWIAARDYYVENENIQEL